MFENIRNPEIRKRREYFADVYKQFCKTLQRKCIEYGAPEGLDQAICGVIFGINEYEYFGGNIPYETYIEQDPKWLPQIRLIEGYQTEVEVLCVRSSIMECLVGALERRVSSKEDIRDYGIKLEKTGLTDLDYGFHDDTMMLIADCRDKFRRHVETRMGNLTRSYEEYIRRDLEHAFTKNEPASFEEARRQQYLDKRRRLISEMQFMRIQAYKAFLQDFDLAYGTAREAFEDVLQRNRKEISRLFAMLEHGGAE